MKKGILILAINRIFAGDKDETRISQCAVEVQKTKDGYMIEIEEESSFYETYKYITDCILYFDGFKQYAFEKRLYDNYLKTQKHKIAVYFK